MKSYKITIEETRTVTKKVGKEWDKLGQKEVERDTAFRCDQDASPTRISDDMGYTPEIEKEVTETREVYVQKTDELDIVGVIRAINGIK